MIAMQEFERGLKELSDLTGQPIRRDTAKAFYDRLKQSDIRDFQNAVEGLASSNEKVNLHALFTHINRHRVEREEKEYQYRRAQEEYEARQFWKANYRDGNCSRNCKSCPAVFCNHVANESIKAMEKILAKEISWQDACQGLSVMFPGVGFEKEVPELQPF